MAIVLGSLLIHLGLESAEFTKGVDKADRDLKKATKSWEETGKSISNWGKGLTAGLTLPLGAFAVASVKAANESKDAMGQVEAALKSMGNAAGFTADQLGDMAASEMSSSLYDDDEILRKVTANLLTFGKVSGDQFKRAQAAAVDLATRLGGDLQGATMMVGKALNDPVKGMAALGRAGVQFTADQKAMIKSMVEAGDAAGAQKLMLAELEKQVGGAAEAARKADPGAAMKQSWAELQETIGAKLLPIFERLAGMLTGLLDRFNNLSPGMQSFIVGAGALAAALGPVLMVIGGITSGIAPLLGAITAFTPALGAAGAATSVLGGFLSGLLPILGPVALAVGAAYLAWKNWDTIGPILSDIGGQIQAALGPAVRSMIDSISSALSSLWNGPFGSLMAKVGQSLVEFGKALFAAVGPQALALLRGLAAAVGEAFKVIGGLLNTLAALLQGDFKGAWEYAKATVIGAVKGIGNIIDAIVPGTIDAMARMVTGIRDWLVGKLNAVWQGVVDKINFVKNAFFALYDAVVGHSYVPDMVDEIGQHMLRLDDLMVKQAERTTKKTAEAFRKLQEEDLAILRDLFPEQAISQDMAKMEERWLATAKRLNLSSQQVAAGMDRIWAKSGPEYGRQTPDILPANDNPLISGFKVTPEMLAELDKVSKATKGMADGVGVQTVRVAESFKDMVDKTLSSVRGLVDGIKKGDVLSVIEGIAGLFMNLGSMGAFGKGVQGRINSPAFDGFRAAGGPVTSGKAYIVGERGPELFSPRASGRIIPNHELGGSSRFEIVPSPYFNVIVDGRAQGVVGQAAPGIASATSSGLQTRMATNQARRLA